MARVLKKIFKTLLLILILILVSCNSKNKKNTESYADIPKIDTRVNALPLKIKSPLNNPQSAEKTNLGRLLFFDPILSGDKDVACATCHHPDNGYAEFRDLSIGVNGKGFGVSRAFNKPNTIPFVKRNAHTVLNTAFNGINPSNHYNPEKSPMFWDSREASLEGQCQGPPTSRSEMRGDAYAAEDAVDSVVSRVANIPEYVQLFDDAFGATGLTPENFTFTFIF